MVNGEQLHENTSTAFVSYVDLNCSWLRMKGRISNSREFVTFNFVIDLLFSTI